MPLEPASGSGGAHVPPDHNPAADPDYTVEVINRLLAQWPRILSLAEGVGSGSVIGGGGHSHRSAGGAHRYWAEVVADVEKAWIQLPQHSRHSRIIEARLQGHSLGAFAAAYKQDRAEVDALYAEALAAMALFLEGPA